MTRARILRPSTGLVLLCAALMAGCNGDTDAADAYGNFESTDVIVSAEVAGRLVSFAVREGDRIASGEPVGQIDTVQLALQIDQIRAQQAAANARLAGIEAELAVLAARRDVAERDRVRLARLLEDGAATPKQMEDVEGRLEVLDREMEAAATRRLPIRAEVRALDAQEASVRDRIGRSRIVNPVRGTVLETYAEASELAAVGKPLYRLAPLDTLELRAWVSGAQLPHLRLGQAVRVRIDEDEDTERTLEGRVSWIASEAEFTPKQIQTKDERVNLVYAFKVRVPNPDGRLKIGMPGEVVLDGPGT